MMAITTNTSPAPWEGKGMKLLKRPNYVGDLNAKVDFVEIKCGIVNWKKCPAAGL
jgi:hypothetical protein